VAAEEEFELERPYEANAAPPASVPVRTAAPAEATAPEPAPSAAPATPGEFEFDLGSTPTIPFQVTPVDEGGEPPEMAEATAPEPPPAAPEPPAAAAPEPPAAPAAAPPAAEAGVGAELVSSTLAELYFKQGHIDKACEVYGQLLEREPANEHVRQRFAELSDLAQRAAAPPATSVAPAPPPTPTPAGDDRAARRQALERTIARLEGFLSAVKRSAP
jgi:pentatricopeptide repeat protein